MKDQPLLLNSAVDLWPWVHFSLGILTSFGRLSGQECFALSLLYEEKTTIPINRLNYHHHQSLFIHEIVSFYMVFQGIVFKLD